jgi:branched-chain amino acid transport system permease protein
MSTEAPADRQHQIYGYFNAELRNRVRALITPALIEEHRQCPLGQGSDALERVKNFLSRPPHYALYSRVPLREWQLIRMPVTPGEPPAPLDDSVYRSENEAYHALFLRHVADLMAT